MKLTIPLVSAIVLYIAGAVTAHNDHSQTVLKQKPSNLRWQDWHMLEEHKLSEYDGKSFFKLHDLKGTGFWDITDILNLYGVAHESIIGDGSGMGEDKVIITAEVQANVVESVFKLFDKNKDGKISLDEWLNFHNNGGELPDFGYGQGHHLDFESEYEEHHWKKYHAENDPDTKIKHKEDIEHELLHHQYELDETHDRSEKLREVIRNYLSPVRVQNIAGKYKRDISHQLM